MTVDHMRDDDARRRIRSSLDESLIVEAAAGTGKTSELVRRIVAVLQTGRAEVGGIVAVTFTRKAAGELKLRLRHELDRRRLELESAVERRRLQEAMVRLEEAHIGTIHSFCADLLREHPVEAGIQPGFEELDERSSSHLFGRVFNRWAQEIMDHPPPGLRRALGRANDWSTARAPLDRIRKEAWKLIEWRDFPSPWRMEKFDRRHEIDALTIRIHELARIAESCPKPRDLLRQALEPVIEFSHRVKRQESVRDRDHDDLEASLVRLLIKLKRNKRKGRGRYSEEHSRESVLAARETMIDRLAGFTQAADADLAATLREELRALVELYNDAKRRAGKLDFMDLLISTRDLIRSHTSARTELQQQFTHIFVDEFQDTDPLQAEILLVLSANDATVTDADRVEPACGKLFLVGDPKQSIYRFRRADFTLYRSLRESLVSKGVGLVYLTSSFRSVPDIQRAVNHAFAIEMTEDVATGQPEYTPLGERSGPIPGQPALIALPVARPYGAWNQVSKKAIDASLPDTIAAWIDWLITESGWRVRNPGASADLIPIAPRHVAILFRRFVSWGEDVTRNYVHAMENRHIPHMLQGARSFHKREEVETLRAALSAVEWPDDTLSVFATLKGSLFAISDETLLAYHDRVGSLHPFGARLAETNDDLETVRVALDCLKRLHELRNMRPFVETVTNLLAECRAHAGFALRPAGNQILANVYRVGDLARRFETQGGRSFRGFVEQLIEESEAEEGGESPVLEEGADGVRIMTVHAAKGLEFPAVILADVTANMASRTPDKHVNPGQGLAAMRLLGCAPWELNDNQKQEHLRDRSEGVRIAYVAATRARDLLVVPAVGDGPLDGWTQTLNPALYPPSTETRTPAPADGCPKFGTASVLERPPNLMSGRDRSVQPGLHHPGSGDYDLVWWDPALLNLDQNANFGVLQEHVLTSKGAEDAAEQSLSDYELWQATRGSRLEAGASPGVEVFSPSDPGAPNCVSEAPVEIEFVPQEEGRPTGTRFGSLVHLVLHDAWEVTREQALVELAEFHGRVVDAPPEERTASVVAVRRALEHPLIRQAAVAARCHREYPVTFETAMGAIMEGVIDLLFEDKGIWHVVDFKTDAHLDTARQRYQAQVSWYTQAVARITKQPAKGFLLHV